VTFDFYWFRFQFRARDPIHFSQGQPGNIVRGAFGCILRRIACTKECPALQGKNIRECALRASCSYAQIFEPASFGAGPSGLSDLPRPLVFRTGHLDGQTAAPGEQFWFDVHLFQSRQPPVEHLTRAFAELANEGIARGRGRADLVSVEQMDQEGSIAPQPGPPISVPLEPRALGTRRLRVEFRTPTELKSGERLVAEPDFGTLFARARDRISTLRALYGDGPLDIDFRALGERAAAVRLVRSELRRVRAERRSSRTGQRHGIGGFVGMVEYEGELDEFYPYIEAARWTGIGRHCVWGKGEVRGILIP
jgi:hypothetical protein